MDRVLLVTMEQWVAEYVWLGNRSSLSAVSQRLRVEDTQGRIAEGLDRPLEELSVGSCGRDALVATALAVRFGPDKRFAVHS